MKKRRNKKHYFEAVCSFFVTGLGQIVKGESKKGLKILLFFYFVLPGVVYAALIINGYLFLLVLGLAILTGITLWIYSMWDALCADLLN
ncbi:MAG: hypothetical protein WCT39_01350 [Candidatus Margulisiibacteriota bacterium]